MRIVFYIIWLLILAVFQPTLARGIAICSIAPNLFLCFVVICGFFRGKYEAGICGAVFGLVYDLLAGRLIGISSLIFLYAGFASGVLSEHFVSSGKRLAGALNSAATTVLSGIVYYAANSIAYGNISFVTAFFRLTIPEAIYNAVISFLISFPILWMMKLMRMERIS